MAAPDRGYTGVRMYEEGLINESKGREIRKSEKKHNFCGAKRGIILTVGVVLVVAFSLGVGIGLRSSRHGQPFAVGAVAADHFACSQVGKDILLARGSAVDAAIASLLCDGVRQPHSMGIGGGCFIVIYQKNPRKIDVINGREFAPVAASIDKFINKSFVQGPLSIAVPTEIMAYKVAHDRYGKLPWSKLFEPAIEMARDGHPLSNSTARALQILTKRFNLTLTSFPELCKFFCDEHGGLKKQGDLVKMPNLAKTLSGIAKNGPDYLYKGKVAETLLKEIEGFGGLVTKEDFAMNLTRLERPLEYRYGDLTMYVPTAPSGGPVMGLILEILEVFPKVGEIGRSGKIGIMSYTESRDEQRFNLTSADIATPPAEAATYHKIIEAFKFAYADRLKLGDPLYIDLHDLLKKMTSPKYAALLRTKIDTKKTHNTSYYSDITAKPWQEHGTAQINVLAPNGDSVSVCSTVNYYFGSLLVSPSTGIILNNEMADFSVPNLSYLDNLKAAPPNYIAPGKQPLSSMAPAIFVDKKGDPRLVIGSSGGARISTVNAQVAVRILWLKQSVKEAVRHKRFHHQLFPDVVRWEPGFQEDILRILHEDYGHALRGRSTYMAVLQAIYRDPDTHEVHAFSDERKRGKASVVYSGST